MPTNLTRSSFDTFTAEQFPNTNHGAWRKLNVSGGGGTRRYAYLWWAGKPPAGASVSSATLRLWLRGSWSGGPHTITARKINATWKESLLTWNRSGAGQMGSTVNPASVAVTGGVDGQEVELDVSLMMADIAAGEAFHGIRLEVNTTGVKALYSSESTPTFRPQLEVVWNRAPLAPVDMAPTGGRSVSESHPVLTWVFKDREGDAQAEFQVQTSTSSTVTSSGFTSVEFNSGWVASSEGQLDLSTTAYAGVSNGATRYWIVRTKDETGLISPWSAVASFRRDNKGGLVINSPVNGGTVDETTPSIVTTLTGAAQEAIAYRLWEENSTGQFVSVWSTGWFEAPAASGVSFQFGIPAGYIKRTGRDYRLDVWSRDTVDREATPGDPVHVPKSATFTFIKSATPSPVINLTVTDDAPGVKLTWNRSAASGHPDYWCLVVDGVRVYSRLDPVDFTQGGSPISYALVYYGAAANVPHEFEIEAVVDDAGRLKHSQANDIVVHTPDLTLVGGTWLVDDDQPPYPSDALPRRVRIRDAEVPDLEVGESSGIFYPIARRDPVIIVDAIRGHEGTLQGTVQADDPAGDGFIENFRWFKRPANVGRRLRLVFGDINIPIQLGKATDTHHDSHMRRHRISAEVSQVDEFEGDPLA